MPTINQTGSVVHSAWETEDSFIRLSITLCSALDNAKYYLKVTESEQDPVYDTDYSKDSYAGAGYGPVKENIRKIPLPVFFLQRPFGYGGKLAYNAQYWFTSGVKIEICAYWGNRACTPGLDPYIGGNHTTPESPTPEIPSRVVDCNYINGLLQQGFRPGASYPCWGVGKRPKFYMIGAEDNYSPNLGTRILHQTVYYGRGDEHVFSDSVNAGHNTDWTKLCIFSSVRPGLFRDLDPPATQENPDGPPYGNGSPQGEYDVWFIPLSENECSCCDKPYYALLGDSAYGGNSLLKGGFWTGPLHLWKRPSFRIGTEASVVDSALVHGEDVRKYADDHGFGSQWPTCDYSLSCCTFIGISDCLTYAAVHLSSPDFITNVRYAFFDPGQTPAPSCGGPWLPVTNYCQKAITGGGEERLYFIPLPLAQKGKNLYIWIGSDCGPNAAKLIPVDWDQVSKYVIRSSPEVSGGITGPAWPGDPNSPMTHFFQPYMDLTQVATGTYKLCQTATLNTYVEANWGGTEVNKDGKLDVTGGEWVTLRSVLYKQSKNGNDTGPEWSDTWDFLTDGMFRGPGGVQLDNAPTYPREGERLFWHPDEPAPDPGFWDNFLHFPSITVKTGYPVVSAGSISNRFRYRFRVEAFDFSGILLDTKYSDSFIVDAATVPR